MPNGVGVGLWLGGRLIAMLARLEGGSRHSLDVDLLYSSADDLGEAEDAVRSAAAVSRLVPVVLSHRPAAPSASL
jgi:hypothetical protein